ncbi:uncharacterized protein RJT20DRAFT_147835 [Scheffersomyces xylosifermentans]|uniref:uncharacterized protein n=1 Tax=Scheffersomyces xylosifermentans TaxID=1304137 RepID=UPI00315DFF2D
MNVNSSVPTDGFIDGLGNWFYSGTGMMTPASELVPVFNFSDYKNLTPAKEESCIDEVNDDGTDIDIDINEEETSKENKEDHTDSTIALQKKDFGIWFTKKGFQRTESRR